MAAGRAEVLQEGFKKKIGDTSRMLRTFLKPWPGGMRVSDDINQILGAHDPFDRIFD